VGGQIQIVSDHVDSIVQPSVFDEDAVKERRRNFSTMMPPLKRTIFNFLTNPKIKKHLRPVYLTVQDFLDGDLLSRNLALKNRHEGERCFILCTGSSLSEIDLNRLRHEYTFGTGYLGCPEQGIEWENETKRYLWVLGDDPDASKINPFELNRHRWPHFPHLSFFSAMGNAWALFIDRRARQQWLDFYRATGKAFPNPETIFFMNGADRRFYEKHRVLAGRRTHYVKASERIRSAKKLVNDLTERITFMDGSFFFMVAASIYMGFKEIYLCGCGYTYQPLQVFHFYDDPVFPLDLPGHKRDKVINEIMKVCGVTIYKAEHDENNYRPVFVCQRPVEVKHEIIHEFARQRGVKIYNIVPRDFESPIYEKITWNAVVENVLAAPSRGDRRERSFLENA
jgi:hypothetical protein